MERMCTVVGASMGTGSLMAPLIPPIAASN